MSSRPLLAASIESPEARPRRRAAPAAVFSALVFLMMLWLTGRLHAKVSSEPRRLPARPSAGVRVAAVRRVSVPVVESAVGTIAPVYESQVASKVLARVVSVSVKAGQSVREGETLVRLDDADLRARREQARAELLAAAAEDEQARRDVTRGDHLHAKAVMSDLDWERCHTRARTAAAQLSRARQTASEAEANLSFGTVRAPRNATVVDKRVDVGDIVRPGDALLTLYDPARMQLVASVRESLATRLAVGQSVELQLASRSEPCKAEVTEIVPEAEARSRSFSVKAVGACGARVYKGMFGRLLIPLAGEDVLVVPAASVSHVGQLDLVDVVEDGELVHRIVQLGRTSEGGESVQVLSGLREGEEIAVERSHG
jgi:RND family efflux transporter MFP subunit